MGVASGSLRAMAVLLLVAGLGGCATSDTAGTPAAPTTVPAAPRTSRSPATTGTPVSTAGSTTPPSTAPPAPASIIGSTAPAPSSVTTNPADTLVAYPQYVGDPYEYRPGAVLTLRWPEAPRARPVPVVVTLDSGIGHTFASRGFAAAQVDPPLHSTGQFDADTVDAVRAGMWEMAIAVRWLRANAATLGIDPRAIAAVGYSFGAIAALALAYSEDGRSAAAPTISLDAFGSTVVGRPLTPPEVPPELATTSDDVAAVVAVAGFAMPGAIEAGEAPALLLHGRADTVVPFTLAEQTCAAATAVGVVCELVPLDGGHLVDLRSPALLDRAVAFLDRIAGRTAR